jgi:hypothetical protein
LEITSVYEAGRPRTTDFDPSTSTRSCGAEPASTDILSDAAGRVSSARFEMAAVPGLEATDGLDLIVVTPRREELSSSASSSSAGDSIGVIGVTFCGVLV